MKTGKSYIQILNYNKKSNIVMVYINNSSYPSYEAKFKNGYEKTFRNSKNQPLYDTTDPMVDFFNRVIWT